MRFLPIMAILGSSLLLPSCKKSSGVRAICELSCSENLACTSVFVSIVADFVYANDAGVVFDDFEVVRKSDGKVILRNEKTTIRQAGRYLLFTDGQLKETSKCGEDFVAKGYINGRQVISEPYKIAHNCCHVVLVSGNQKVVVQ